MALRVHLFCAAALIGTSSRGELLVHLPFDSNARDVSGHSHHAMPNGGARIDRQYFQIGGGAACFDGSNSCFSVPFYSPVLGNRPRSIGFWVQTTNACLGSPNVVFLGWGDTSSDVGIRYDLGLESGASTRLRNEFNAGKFVVSSATSVDFADGRWHQVLTTYDGSMVRFYVDGKSYGDSLPVRSELATGVNAAGFVIGGGVREGARRHNANRFFRGQIDDVGIWSSALDATDAALLHGLGRIGNDLHWLEKARRLWDGPSERTAVLNGRSWKKINGLAGSAGDWLQAGHPNARGSFIVLDARGGGIQLLPKWWENPWAQVSGRLVALVGALLLFLGFLAHVRTRVRLHFLRLHESREGERRRIARDLHDQIGADLTQITLLGELARDESLPPEAIRARVATLNQKLREAVRSLDSIVWELNPKNDTLPSLVGYLQDFTQEFCRPAAVRSRLDVDPVLPSWPVSVKARHHLFLSVKEALNNTIKHSGASEVWLRVHCNENSLCVTIEDNGLGIEPSCMSSQRSGLKNFQTRLAEIGGKAEIVSKPGMGCRIEFSVRRRALEG